MWVRRINDVPGLAQSDGEPEDAARVDLAVDSHAAAHRLHQPFAERETQSGSTIDAGEGSVGLFEGREQMRLVRSRDADARITYLETQQDGGGGLIGRGHAHLDRACDRELDGVAGQVEQDLPQAQGVTMQRSPGKFRRHLDAQRQTLFGCLSCQEVIELLQDSADLEVDRIEGETLGFDPGDVENVVDDR